MKISRNWLQTFFSDPLPDAAALADALTFHAFEIESVVNLGDDDVLDVKVTPNRGHDCLCHRGIAKELAAILQIPLVADPLRTEPKLEPLTARVSVAIDDRALCKRYIAGYIRGVTVRPSPEWLRGRLEAIGQRSINNVVDATNYVMFHLGQPLHAFDAGQLCQDNILTYGIRVRRARDGETMIALDEKEYTLTDSMLVIADDNSDAAIGIAGVKGGKPAGITESTTDIIIESANFDGVSVRKTAQALRLRTDASSRFEQVVSPQLAAHGMRAAVDLVIELAGGTVEGFSDVYPVAQERTQVSVATGRANALLGTSFGGADIAAILARLDLAHTENDGSFQVHVPLERLDLVLSEDLIEEIGRIAGYDHVPATELPPLKERPVVNASFALAEHIREFLVAQGFSEIVTTVFADQGERAVANKVDSTKPYLRSSLLANMRDALEKNVRNKDLLGIRQVRLFEIGTRWSGGVESHVLGLAVEKKKKEETVADVVRAIGSHLGIEVGTVGDGEEVIELPLDELAARSGPSEAYDALPPSSAARYEPFSRYPFIARDVALWTPSGTKAEEVAATIHRYAGELALRIDLFDEFKKDDRVSYAFRIVFQSFDKTLTDFEANERMESVYKGLKEKGYEVR